MLKLVLAAAITLSAASANAQEATKPVDAARGQSVTGPAAERTTGSAAASASRNQAAPSSAQTAPPEKHDGRNAGESGTSKEETPGVNSSTTNAF